MIVFLDMDGVLVNFRRGIHHAFDIDYDYPSLSEKWSFWEDWLDVSFQEVDAVCTVDFLAGLCWMHDGKEILAAVEGRFDSQNIYLLTTPMLNPGSGTGKIQWVKQHLPEYYERLIISTAPKYLFARSNTLLIDDKDNNIDNFCTCGGRTILVPRPWNQKHLVETLPYLQKKLRRY